jgi:hypothetical protein
LSRIFAGRGESYEIGPVEGYRIPLAWLAPALGTAPATMGSCAKSGAGAALMVNF